MNPTREPRDAVVPPLPNPDLCIRKLTAAVVEWRRRLSSGEDWRILQAEILCFAEGDPDVLLALFRIAHRYEQAHSPRVVVPITGRSHRSHLRRIDAGRRARAHRSTAKRHLGPARRRPTWGAR